MSGEHERTGEPEPVLRMSENEFVLGIMETLARKYGQFHFRRDNLGLHRAFASAYEHLREIHSTDVDLRFIVQLDSTHQDSETVHDAIGFMQMIGRTRWGDRTYVDFVVEDRGEEWHEDIMQTLPGDEELYEELAKIFINSYGLERL